MNMNWNTTLPEKNMFKKNQKNHIISKYHLQYSSFLVESFTSSLFLVHMHLLFHYFLWKSGSKTRVVPLILPLLLLCDLSCRRLQYGGGSVSMALCLTGHVGQLITVILSLFWNTNTQCYNSVFVLKHKLLWQCLCSQTHMPQQCLCSQT